jgi:uncharacterized protein (TIGR00251 family)
MADPKNEQVPWLESHSGGGVVLLIAAQPNGKRSEILGEHGGYLKIRVASPPVDGAANEALVAFLAEIFGLKQRHITLISGRINRKKAFLIHGVEYFEMRRLLGL